MAKNLVIIVLLAVTIGLSMALIRVENQRYALFLHMCRDWSNIALPPDGTCLATVQTRTHWVWHVFYAVTEGW